MRYGRSLIPTTRQAPSDASTVSHSLLLRAGYLRRVGAGLYGLLPLGVRVLENIQRIVAEEMSRAGAERVLLPALLPAEYFRESGRWDDLGPELIRLQDRNGGDHHLAPAHEEIVTDLARREIHSHRDLPRSLYQMQVKFCDESRPRGGLLHCREFVAKDAYSFDADAAGAEQSYGAMRVAHGRIFARAGLSGRVVAAESGRAESTRREEFHLLVPGGEDVLAVCEACEHASTLGLAEGRGGESARDAIVAAGETRDHRSVADGDDCPRCEGRLRLHRSIAVSHVDIVGTRYSQRMGATFLDRNKKKQMLVMGRYGLGVSRLMAAVVELQHDRLGILWPMSIAPYSVHLVQIGKTEAIVRAVAELEAGLAEHGLEVLVDDRDERPGVKLSDADLIGIPLRLTLGERSLVGGQVELKERSGKATFGVPLAEAPAHVARRVRQLLRGDRASAEAGPVEVRVPS